MFKEVSPTKVVWHCDICGKEISFENMQIFCRGGYFRQKVFHLCPKHGKMVGKYIRVNKHFYKKGEY